MNGEEVISKLIERYPNTYRNEQKYYIALSLKDSEGKNRNICEIKNKPNLKKVEIILASKLLKDEQVHRVILNHKAKAHQLVKNASFFIVTENDYNNNLDIFDSLYDKTLESIKFDDYRKNSKKNEDFFKDWIKKYIEIKNKNGNHWLAINAKRIWLKGERIKSSLVEFQPIKSLLLEIGTLSYVEKTNIDKLPENLFSLTEDKFIEAKSIIDETYSNHKEELELIIKNSIKESSHNAAVSSFKPTNYAKEYLMALQGEEIQNILKTNQEVKSYSLYVSKLISSKNIIFRGAPGTGKTYLARQIASEIVSNKRTKNFDELTNDEKERIGFVQFHPNYDYTDFVEGYRPVMSENNSNEQMGFELIDGVFKNFVNNAKISQFSGGVDNFDESWAKFYEKVNDLNSADEATYDMTTLTGKPMHLVPYIWRGIEGVWEKGKNGNFYNKEQCYKVYQGKPGVPKGGFDNYRKAIVQHLKDEYGLLDFVPKEDKNLGESFVFIIDEINRGEMSKIFGELFFSIDPGYRGKKGTVQTQYSAVQNPDDAEFYVPENVYIIGTMNDIDRSVESFDFAMRRRFRFIEIKADDERQLKMLEQLEDYETVKARLLSLNNYIGNVDGLNSHYHIGPSYFLKLKDLNYDFELLWSDYIAPLLEEYIRGFYNEEELMESLKLAYDLNDELGEE